MATTSEERFKALMARCDEATKRRMLVEATAYRSGNGSDGVVSMGATDKAVLRQMLHDPYPHNLTWGELAEQLDLKDLVEALKYVRNIIFYMIAHPTRVCCDCGQVVKINEDTDINYVESDHDNIDWWVMTDGRKLLPPAGWTNELPGGGGVKATNLGDVPVKDDPDFLKRIT